MGSTQPADSPLAPASSLANAERREGARGRALRVRLVLIVAVVCAAVWLSTLFDTLHDREATLTMAERQHDNVAGALAEQAARALQAVDLILRQAMLLDPDAPFGYTRDWPLPGLSPLRHFSYAIQWWSFALLALVVWGVTSRRAATSAP